MESERPADPGLASILEELRGREPIFHRPELGTSRADFESMMSPDFWEIGASGRCYSREFILDELQKRHRPGGSAEDVWQTCGFRCQQLALDLYLLTYTLRQGDRLTRRATIWRHMDGAWKIVYHQGTVLAQSKPSA